jgi:hypothetical protein
MTSFHPPASRCLIRTGRWLVSAVLSGVALAIIPATAQGQAAAAPGPARAAAGLLTAPVLIPVNTVNWSASAGFGSRPPAWYTDRSGIVHLQGAARQISSAGAGALVVGTLPAAARPSKFVFTIAHTFNGTSAGLELNPNGEVFVLPPSSPAVTDLSFVSLEGVTYRPSSPGRLIPLNTTNWTGDTCCRAASWYANGSGVVHLQGAVTQSSPTGPGANLIGTLPVTARPAQTVYTIVPTFGGNYADLAIEPNGSLALIDPRPPAVKDYSAVSLESISYRRSAPGTALAINTANWSGSAGFGSRPPAWYTDRSGVVHLQGAVKQTSSTGTGARLIGTLPAAARPSHAVFAIVHTFNGTYADLAIGTDGTLQLIDPRPPLVTDYTFVSLESITYRR